MTAVRVRALQAVILLPVGIELLFFRVIPGVNTHGPSTPTGLLSVLRLHVGLCIRVFGVVCFQEQTGYIFL